MRIIGISGSPRKGNSDLMLETLIKAIPGRNKGIFYLRRLKLRLCDGCDRCFDTGKNCHIKDRMPYNELEKADVIILASPNYFKNVSALMKNFMDRTNPLILPPKLKGKKAIGLCVGGQKLENTEFCANVLKEFFKDQKMKIVGIVKARANGKGEMKKKIKERLIRLAKSL